MPKITRMVTLLACAAGVFLFICALPAFYIELRDHCVGQPCPAFYDTPPTQAWLERQGLNAAAFAAAYTILYGAFGFVCISAGLLIFAKRASDYGGQLAAVSLVYLGFTFASLPNGLSAFRPELGPLVDFVGNLYFLALLLFFFTFPNGRFDPRWTRWLLAALLVPGIARWLLPGTSFDIKTLSPALFNGWVVLWMLSLIAVQIYRYRRVLTPLERQQTKWAVFGMSGAIAGLLAVSLLYMIKDAWLRSDPYLLFGAEALLLLAMALLPVSLVFALLKRRLWDIDPIVNRTIVYGTLSLIVISVYTAAVWYLDSLFRGAVPYIPSLLAAGLVAVLFAPLKERLQRGVNRLIYGEVGDPLSVLARLGNRLSLARSPHAAPDTVVRTVKDALRLPYAALALQGPEGERIVAESGVSHAHARAHRIDLVHQGEPVGALLASPRLPEESFSASDLRFLDMLAQQAAVIAWGAAASLEVARIETDLRESRERLVLAREEERRRLRNNLHDDLAPRLAALAFTASAGEALIASDPAKTKDILVELQSVIRTTVSDIRRLVHDLRPPALDELGLLGAVRERIDDLSRPLRIEAGPKPAEQRDTQGDRVQASLAAAGFADSAAPRGPANPADAEADAGHRLRFRLEAPDSLPPLPAAVEVAAFRILTEAIVNVFRHAPEARVCNVAVRLGQAGGGPAELGREGLYLEVRDDGKRGVKTRLAPGAASGIGLSSMRERAEELGGYCRLEPAPDGGMALTAYLPLHPIAEEREPA